MENNNIIITLRYNVNLDRGVVRQRLPVEFGTGDKEAHKIILTACRAAGVVDLTGAGVMAYVNRNDGTSVIVDGTVEDGKAVVILPEACYAVNGAVSIVVKITMDESRTTALWLDGHINRASNDTLVDPGNVVPSLESLLAEIDNMRTATDEANSAADNANKAAEEIQGKIDELRNDVDRKYSDLSEDIYEGEEERIEDVSLDVKQGYYGLTGTFYVEAQRTSAIMTVTPGTEYILDTEVRSTIIAAIIFFDTSGAVLSYDKTGSGTLEEITDYRFAVPEGASQMAVQSATGSGLALRKVEIGKNLAFYTKEETDERYLRADEAEKHFATKDEIANADYATQAEVTQATAAVRDQLTGVQKKLDAVGDAVFIGDEERITTVPLAIKNGYYLYSTGAYYEEAGRKSAIVPVVAGEEYILTAYLSSAAIAAIIFFDDSGAVLSYDKKGAGTQESFTDYRYTVPDGAAQMVVQNGWTGQPDPYLRKVETVESASFYTKEESDARYATRDGVADAKYGIKWSIADPDDLGSRCFAAEGLTATIGVGATDGQSDFDNIYPWSEMKRCNIRINSAGAQIVTFEGEDGFALDGSNGDVFVRIPRFSVEKYTQDGYEYRVITADGTPHPAFVEAGRVLDEIFVGAYEGYIDADSKLCSQAGVIPTSNRVAADYLAAARANSSNHTLYDMRTVDAIWTLLAVEYGCRNASQVLGYGAADFMQANAYYAYLMAVEAATASNTIKITGGWPDARKVYMPVGSNMLICKGDQETVIAERKILSIEDDGTYMTITFDGTPVEIDTTCFVGSAALTTNFVEDCPTGALTWHTGRAAWDSGAEIRNPIRYRWIENIHGNLWHFLPDVTFNDLQMYVCEDMSKYEFCGIGDGYNPVGDVMLQQSSNGSKADIVNSNYWINTLVNDHFARGVAMGKSWDMSLLRHQAFGAYYYLNAGRMGIVNGGGFDHLWRCNMLTQRAWVAVNYKWYLVGARMLYKHII